MPGGPGGVDGTAETGGSMPGAADTVDGALRVAETGDGGDASGLAAPGPGGEGGGFESSTCRIIGEKEPGGFAEGVGPAIEEAAERYRRIPGSAGGFTRETVIRKEHSDGEREEAGAGAGGRHPAGT